MAENKTVPTDVPVQDFVTSVQPDTRQQEAKRVVTLLTEATGVQPVMWGPSIIGWGVMHYKSAAGREGDWMKVGFSPRKAQLTFYGLKDVPGADPLLAALGPHTTGVGCVYVKRLEQVDESVLRELAVMAFQRGDYDASSGT